MSDSEGYRIKQQLGTGLAGPIFLADTASGNVVVRQFKSQAPAGSNLRSAERSHFLQAATAGSALTQPGVVRVLEAIDEGDEAFEVMEYIPYETLKDALASKMFEKEDANQIIRGIANILHGVHQSGLTHGDLKPSNVFLLPKREIKISDFGISPRARRELGTLPLEWKHAYLASEHFSNRQSIGPRSDQYSLAAIAYHLYTGQLPFRSAGSTNLTDRGQLRPASEIKPEISRATDAVLAKALSAEPQERYASCLQFVYFLDASFLPVKAGAAEELDEPSKSWGLWPLLAVAAAVLLAVLATFALTRSRGPGPVVKTVLRDKPVAVDLPPIPQPPVAKVLRPTRKTVPSANSGPSTPPDASASRKSAKGGMDGTGDSTAGQGKDGATIAPVALTQAPHSLELQVFSRNHPIEDGLSFGYKDPTFGELAAGDISALVRGPVPKGKLTLTWFQDKVNMGSRIVVPNHTVQYGNEPTPGVYRVVLMVNSKEFKTFGFRITE